MIKLVASSNTANTRIKLSGSKSLSNRLLILKEVLETDIRIENISDSEDTLLLQKALQQIKGKQKTNIDVHHAGTTMRFLTAFFAVKEGEWFITGSERMKERPIGELVNALRLLGAEITYTEKENYPPLLIKGKKLSGGKITIDSSVSSQFVSALLLIAPKLMNGLMLELKGKTVSRPYIDMTIVLLKSVGINIRQEKNFISITPSDSDRDSISHFLPDNYLDSILVESDWSSASYWYSICSLAGNIELEISHLKKASSQADSVLPEIYKNLGVKTTFKEDSIILKSINLLVKDFSYDFTNCPDIAQTIAVTCFGLGIKAELKGLQTLKVKETDRILALKIELEKLGARVEIGSDWLRMEERSSPIFNSQSIHTYNDHRMAMSFAPLALVVGELSIEDETVITKSYPAFWEDLKSVGFSVNLQP